MAKRKPNLKQKPKAPPLAYLPVPRRGYAGIDRSLWDKAVPIELLEPDPQNPNQHDETSITAIVASLRQFGQFKPIVVNTRNRQVVAGNGTLEAAKRLGWSHLAATLRAMTPSQQRAIAVADNRSAEFSTWNEELLDRILAQMAEETPDLYADLLLDDLRQVEEPAEEEDTEPAASEEPISKTYEVIIACHDEKEQKTLFEDLKRQGHNCRTVTI